MSKSGSRKNREGNVSVWTTNSTMNVGNSVNGKADSKQHMGC